MQKLGKGHTKLAGRYLRVSRPGTNSVYCSGIVEKPGTLETEKYIFKFCPCHLLHDLEQITWIYRPTVSLSLNLRQ